jgi:hypothetical protein
MALGKALLVGAVAAIGVPYVMADETGRLGEWLHRGLVHPAWGEVAIPWSWPLFATVTLFAWGFLAWANK